MIVSSAQNGTDSIIYLIHPSILWENFKMNTNDYLIICLNKIFQLVTKYTTCPIYL